MIFPSQNEKLKMYDLDAGWQFIERRIQSQKIPGCVLCWTLLGPLLKCALVMLIDEVPFQMPVIHYHKNRTIQYQESQFKISTL